MGVLEKPRKSFVVKGFTGLLFIRGDQSLTGASPVSWSVVLRKQGEAALAKMKIAPYYNQTNYLPLSDRVERRDVSFLY